MTRRAVRIALVLAVTAAVMTATAGVSSAQVAATIKGRDQRWHPGRVTISAGQTVRWKAVDTTHTVTSYGGGWSKDTRLSAGETTKKTFNSSGTYKFYCTIHGSVSGGVCSGMCGRIRVT
jgi:plastocyanin